MSAKRDLRKEEKLDELRAERDMNASKMAAMTPGDRLDYVQKKSRKKLILAAVAVAIVILFNLATSHGSNTPDTSAAQTTSVVEDASAIMACDQFTNVMADAIISTGEAQTKPRQVYSDAVAAILSNPELRDKIQQIYSDAQGATTAGITDGAQRLLATATANDGTAFRTAVDTFAGACKTIGY